MSLRGRDNGGVLTTMDFLVSDPGLSREDSFLWAWRHYTAYQLTGKRYRFDAMLDAVQCILSRRVKKKGLRSGKRAFLGEEHRIEAGTEALAGIWSGLKLRRVKFQSPGHLAAWIIEISEKKISSTFLNRSLKPIPPQYQPPRYTAPNPVNQAITREFLHRFKSTVVEQVVESSKFPALFDDLLRVVAIALIDKKILKKSLLKAKYGMTEDTYQALLEYVEVRIRIIMRRQLRENQDLLDLSALSSRVPDKRLSSVGSHFDTFIAASEEPN